MSSSSGLRPKKTACFATNFAAARLWEEPSTGSPTLSASGIAPGSERMSRIGQELRAMTPVVTDPSAMRSKLVLPLVPITTRSGL